MQRDRQHFSTRLVTKAVVWFLFSSISIAIIDNNRVVVVDGFSVQVQHVGRIHTSAKNNGINSINRRCNRNHGNLVVTTTTARARTTITTRTRTATQLEMMAMAMSPLPPFSRMLTPLFNEHTIRIAETWAPTIGILTSTLLYLAPANAVWNVIQRARRGKNDNSNSNTCNNSNSNNDDDDYDELMDGLNPLPISIMPAVALSWFAYGLVSSDPYLILGNLPGSVLSVAYLIGILPLMNYNNNSNNNSSSSSNINQKIKTKMSNKNNRQLRLTHAVVLVSTAATLGLWATIGMMTAGATDGLMLRNGVIGEALGVYASSLFIILSGSPLSTIRTVLRTKNSQTILGLMTAAQCVNTGLWTVYGLAVHDHFVWGPNIIGLGLGLIQLTLKILFPSKKGAVRRGTETPSSSSPAVTSNA